MDPGNVVDCHKDWLQVFINPINPMGKSLKKQKPCTKVHLVLNLHIKSHKLMVLSGFIRAL